MATDAAIPAVPAAAPIAVAQRPPAASRADTIRAVTGGQTRAVWIRDLGDGTDILGFGGQVTIVGFDTEDSEGERPIVGEPGSYAKPLFTQRGDRVVYADRADDAVRIVDWSGANLRRVADGFPLATWIDPESAVEWVYVGRDPRGTDPESYGEVHRHQIDQPDVSELVWNSRAVSGDSFQLSRDGRLAGTLARWPEAGVIDLANDEWYPLGEGCWTSLAGDDSGLFWYFDGQHRNLTMVDTQDDDRRWTVNINGAPGIDGSEVYHPRWSNHPRFLTMTGPYTVGGGDNKIRGGGRGVEIHVGRFASDHSQVDAWAQITSNDAADFYPDVWITPDARVPEGTAAPVGASDTIQAAPIVVEARVRTSVPLPTPGDIAPYRNGLLVLEYEVVQVLEGSYDASDLLAAHWIISEATPIEGARRPAGTVLRLRLDPWAAHPELEGERLVMDTDRFDLPLLYDVESAP